LNTLNAINFMKKMNSNIESLNISYDNLINKQNNIEENAERLFQSINNSKQVRILSYKNILLIQI